MIRLMTDDAGRLEIDFDDVSMDGFLRVARWLEDELGAAAVGRLDGIGEAYWDYRLDGVLLTLHHHDMMGNVLYHADEPGRAAIERLFPVVVAAGLYPED
jgi:hypothetical protein